MSIPKNGILDVARNQIQKNRDEGLAQVAYGRGNGLDDNQWAQFAVVQDQVAAQHEAAAARLRAAVADMGATAPSEETLRTVKLFNQTFGADAASPDAMTVAANRYDIAANVLRDRETFIADGLSMTEYLGLNGAEEIGMGAMDPGGTRLYINLGHPEVYAEGPDVFADGLVRLLGHDPFHARGSDLTDQIVDGIKAYRWGRPPNQLAYKKLRQEPERAMVNPDHLTSFSRALRND